MQKKIFSFIFLICICFGISFAQKVTVTGRISDAASGEVLPFAGVYLKGSTDGVFADYNGDYTIEVSKIGDTLAVEYIGYLGEIGIVTKAEGEVLNFKLKPEETTTETVVINAGENPAIKYMKKVFANKDRNKKSAFPSLEYESYEKLELDLTNISSKMRKQKMFKDFAFVFDNIDSTSDEKAFLPMYMCELISQNYSIKNQKDIHIVPKAERIAGTNNQSALDLVRQADGTYEIYDDFIPLMSKNFVSPCSSLGLLYYDYYLYDSTMMNNKWSYKIKFKPKRKQESTFVGEMWVADKLYAVQQLTMNMSSDVNINFINRIMIQENYAPFQDTFFLPTKHSMIIDFVATEKKEMLGFIGRKTVSYRNYICSDTLTKLTIRKKEKAVEGLSTQKEMAYWETHRHDPLTINEAKVYAMVDSVKKLPIYKTYVDIIYTIVEGYRDFGKFELGPYFYLYSSNRVEGNRFRIGGRTTVAFSNRLRLGGYVAYGTKDQRFKYSGNLIWNVRMYPRLTLGTSYKDDVIFTPVSSEKLGKSSGLLFGNNPVSSLSRRTFVNAEGKRSIVPLKLIHTQEFKLYGENVWAKGLSSRFVFMNRTLIPYQTETNFPFSYLKTNTQTNRIDTVHSTRSTEISASLRWSYKEKELQETFERSTLGTPKALFELQYTQGLKILGGEYNFQKLSFSVMGYKEIGPIGWTNYHLEAGKTFGTLPYLLLDVVQGNESYFYSSAVFNGLNAYEMACDQYISLKLEHHFDGLLFNRLPLIRKLKLREVAHFKTIWGSLSAANQQANSLNYVYKNELDPSKSIPLRAPSKIPYMEAGFGITNILKLIRLDAVWRINYLDNPDAPQPYIFTPRIGLEFYF